MLKKRSFTLARHRTSVALEEDFWMILEKEAEKRDLSLAGFVTEIDARRGPWPLASALRLAALEAVKRGS